MRMVKSALIALLVLAASARSAGAQLSWDVENFQTYFAPHVGAPGFGAGFTATVFFRNVNEYADADITSVRGLSFWASVRLTDFCTRWGLVHDDCNMLIGPNLGRVGIRGNVQTETIPLAGYSWVYTPSVTEDSCSRNCYHRAYDFPWVGLLGCQGPAPGDPFDLYSGRTCAEDGYDGSLFMNVNFRYDTYDAPGPDAVPLFEFRESDLVVYAHNQVQAGPNVFVHATPEPGTWMLTATGLMLFAGVARRRAGRRA